MNFLSRTLILSCLCLIWLAGSVGCDSGKNRNATVQGTVTIDGELAKSGTVVFHPADDIPTAYGTIRSDGTFALRIGQGKTHDLDHSKISPGDYIATVMIRGPSVPDEELGEGAPPKPGPRLSAAKYGSKETSGLAYTIESGRLNVINIEVESPSEEELLAEKAEEEKADDEADVQETEEQPGGEEESAPGADASQETDALELEGPPQEGVENSAEGANP